MDTRKLVFTVVLFAGLAGAQDPGATTWDLLGWMRDPMLFALALAALVRIVRAQIPPTFQHWVDGPFRVFMLGAFLGVAIGVVGQSFVYLEVLPFKVWPNPYGGAVYGLFIALQAFLGVNLLDLVAGRLSKATTSVQSFAGLPFGLKFEDLALQLLQARFPQIPIDKLREYLPLIVHVFEVWPKPVERTAQLLEVYAFIKRDLGLEGEKL